MPNVAKGEVRWTEHGAVARITVGRRERESFPMPLCKTEEAATERCAFVAKLATRLRKAGVIKTREAFELLKTAAACSPAVLPGVTQVAGELIRGEFKEGPKMPTFAEFAKRWTSGELAKKHPDHIKVKDSHQDEKRLAKVCALPFGLTTIGDIPLDRFQLDHAEAIMASLPEDVKRSATRRHYAQIVHRVMQLAVYPCRLIAANPLPRGFLPKIGRPPAYPYLYPAEDARLLGHAATLLCFRLLYGFLSREGCREGEAFALRVRDFDLETGTVSLDDNKTDDPRTWALELGTTRARCAPGRQFAARAPATTCSSMTMADRSRPSTAWRRLCAPACTRQGRRGRSSTATAPTAASCASTTCERPLSRFRWPMGEARPGWRTALGTARVR